MAETPPSVDRGPLVIGISTMMIFLVIVTYALRLWIRKKRHVKWGLDDTLLVFSFAFMIGYYIIILLEVNYGGLGKPIILNFRANPLILERFLQLLFAQELITPMALTLLKCSILAMYARLFPTRFIKRACIATTILVLAWAISVIVPSIVRCDPVSKAWSPFMLTGTCNAATGDWIAWQDGIPEFATNVIIFGLPLYEIGRLSASVRTQLAISAVFIIGALSIFSSVFRFVLGYKAHEKQATIGGGDATLDTADLLLWAHIEVCLGFIAACLPSLRPLFIALLRKVGLSKQAPLPPGRDVVTFGGSGGSGGTDASSRKGVNRDEITGEPRAGGSADGRWQGANGYKGEHGRPSLEVEEIPMGDLRSDPEHRAAEARW